MGLNLKEKKMPRIGQKLGTKIRSVKRAKSW